MIHYASLVHTETLRSFVALAPVSEMQDTHGKSYLLECGSAV